MKTKKKVKKTKKTKIGKGKDNAGASFENKRTHDIAACAGIRRMTFFSMNFIRSELD